MIKPRIDTSAEAQTASWTAPAFTAAARPPASVSMPARWPPPTARFRIDLSAGAARAIEIKGTGAVALAVVR